MRELLSNSADALSKVQFLALTSADQLLNPDASLQIELYFDEDKQTITIEDTGCGMTREELIGINAGIVKEVSLNLVNYSPDTILIVVSNPMDTMTYLVHKTTGVAKNRIIGMGGALDSARFKYRLAEALNAPISDVDGMVIGGHSDKGMVPLISKATRNSIKVTNFLSNERLDKVREDTKVGGATLTKLLGTSAWYAPGAAVSSLVHSIACDHNKIFPCSALLQGEYGLSDLCIGVPVVLGKNGIEEIIELDLVPTDLAHLTESAYGVKKTNSLLS